MCRMSRDVFRGGRKWWECEGRMCEGRMCEGADGRRIGVAEKGSESI